MNPRKAKDLLTEVSEATSIDLQCLKALTGFYWDSIHRELTSLQSNYILVPHLGTFTIKNEKALLKTIDRYEKLVMRPRAHPPKTMGRYAIYRSNEEKLAKLYKLLDSMHADSDKRREVKIIRKNERELKENLGAQKPDHGGDIQQDLPQTGGGEGVQTETGNMQQV